MKKSLLCVLFGLGLLSGCATIFNKHKPYPVQITSVPSEAHFTVTNRAGVVVAEGTTPEILLLKAYAGPYRGETYVLTFRKTGYEPHTIVLDSSINGAYFGNIIFGGPVGLLIVDPITGAMFGLPETAAATLVKSIAPQTSEQSLHIISIEQLTAEQKAQLQPLASR